MLDFDALFSGLQYQSLQFISGWRHMAPEYCLFHQHDGIEIVYHPSGRGVTRCISGGEEVHFQEQSVVIYGYRVPHEQEMSVPGEDVFVVVGVNEELRSLFPPMFHIETIREPYIRQEMNALATMSPALGDWQQAALSHRLASLMIYLLQDWLTVQQERDRTSADLYAERAYEFIRERAYNIRQLGEVSQRLGISNDYLRHVFQARYQMSLIHWLNCVRITRAKELLLHSDLPVKKIAQMCGFSNERYFSKVFRRLELHPPGESRRVARQALYGLEYNETEGQIHASPDGRY